MSNKVVGHVMVAPIILLFLLLVPLSFIFAYSVSDYNPAYTPYNLEQAIDARLCGAEVRDFDSDYDALTRTYNDSLTEIILISGVQGSVNNINAWLEANELYYSTEFKDCIRETAESDEEQAEEDAREEYVRMGLSSCDLEVIEDLTEKEEIHYEDKLMPCVEARTAEIEAAVAVCDFDFFDTEMTRKERNDWFVEREYCEDNPPEVIESEPIPEPAPEPVATPVYVPPVTTITPEPIMYTSPTPASVETPVVQVEPEISPEPVETEVANVATTSTSTIELTQEKLDKLVEERAREVAQQEGQEKVKPEPEPEKPSFFKRVWNFFTDWF